MTSRLWSSAALLALCVICLNGCGDLAVELEPGDKDRLADFIEDSGSAPDPTPDVAADPDMVMVEPEVTPDAPGAGFDPTGLTRLDHLALDALLAEHVSEGLVDYPRIEASFESRELLDRALGLFAAVDPEQLEGTDERLAFWLNAYNTLVLSGVLDALRASSTFSPADSDFDFFKAPVHTLGGDLLSLDQIEHGVIRGQWDHPAVAELSEPLRARVEAWHEGLWDGATVDPRIHVGLNCAATSCPPLPPFAFLGSRVDAQLDERATLFVADPSRGAGPNGVSSLFDWFSGDFEASEFGSGRGFIEAFRDDTSGVDFESFLPYDWTLNCDGC